MALNQFVHEFDDCRGLEAVILRGVTQLDAKVDLTWMESAHRLRCPSRQPEATRASLAFSHSANDVSYWTQVMVLNWVPMQLVSTCLPRH